ncbi:MAG: hypothetical protein KDC98_25800 [Planctomycetes bacterium]|nr:hypothetical protein [Planctomycetota bacterium]
MIRLAVVLLPSLVVAGALAAQDPGDFRLRVGPLAGLADLRAPIRPDGVDTAGCSRERWAAGSGYKVSFHDGMTFVPYLGADYPHNQPWSWRTVSVRAGTEELLAGDRAAEHRNDDYRYEYRLGAVTETYDVRAEGLEQSFVIHAPTGAGELVVTGAITTGLDAATVPAAHRALVFHDDGGRPIFEYGAAIAFDATGRRTPVATAFADGLITLTVPADWMATAAFPVTIDPLLTRHPAAGLQAGLAVTSCDLACGNTTQGVEQAAAIVRAASAGDHDMQVVLLDLGYNMIAAFNFFTFRNEDGAAVAYVGGQGRYAMAFRDLDSATNTSSVRVMSFNGSAGITRTISRPPGVNDWRPDVGGVDVNGLDHSALIVFQREDNSGTTGGFGNTSSSDVYGQLFDLSTGSLQGSEFAIASGPNDHERPSVNKANFGFSSPWMCVWQTATNQRWSIFGKQISPTAPYVSVATWYPDFTLGTTEHAVAPIVDGQYGRYAITFASSSFAQAPSAFGDPTGHRIYVERFDWADGASAPDPAGDRPPVLIHQVGTQDLDPTGMAIDTHNRSLFGLGFHDRNTESAWCARAGINGNLTEGPHLMFQVAGSEVAGPALAFDPANAVFKTGYFVGDPVGQTLYGQDFAYVTPAPITTFGTGCGPSSLIAFRFSQQIGSSSGSILALGGAATAAHFLALSLAPDNQPVAIPGVGSGCSLYVDSGASLLGMFPPVVGNSARWSMSLPEWLPPLTFHFQDWVLENGQLTSTNRLSIPIVK